MTTRKIIRNFALGSSRLIYIADSTAVFAQATSNRASTDKLPAFGRKTTNHVDLHEPIRVICNFPHHHGLDV